MPKGRVQRSQELPLNLQRSRSQHGLQISLAVSLSAGIAIQSNNTNLPGAEQLSDAESVEH